MLRYPCVRISEITSQTAEFNKLATHPLQSWEWGEFRRKTGVAVMRFGVKDNGRFVSFFTMTVHPLPGTPYSIGYIPKSVLPPKEFLSFLKTEAKARKIIFVKFEPSVEKGAAGKNISRQGNLKVGPYTLVKGTRPLFTSFTFCIDLTKKPEELMAQMKSKTRYNVKLSAKKGVTVEEETGEKSFETYLKLMDQTSRRQKFYAHSLNYHRLLWQTLKPAGIAHLLLAKYEGEVQVSWMLFLFKNVLYYPYGGSADSQRNLMASNLILWEAILWGKAHGAKSFDLWGSLGPDATPADPFYGFHRFKEGYGGRLVEFVGSVDLVVDPFLYRIYGPLEKLRWLILSKLR